MQSDLELMNIHVRALFTHDVESRIIFVNEPNGAPVPAPRLYLGRTRAGNVWRFRRDVPENVVRELDAVCAIEPPLDAQLNVPPLHLEEFVGLLESQSPIREISNGPAYRFTEYELPSKTLTTVTENNAETLLRGGFEDLITDVRVEQPFVALVEENRAVSICRSVRILPEAHEAGLETLKDFRGKDFAKNVVVEWARLVRATGAIPLYSTGWENAASQAVARKLGLKFYGTDFQII